MVGEQGWRAGQGPDLAFAYGAGGQRISKQVGGTVGDPGTYREHYIRDAQGNIMATYRLHPNGAFRVQERPIYGSSRVGLYAGKVDLYPATQLVPMPQVIPVFDALLRYELTDHLGNVGTVVTGRLLPGDGAPHEAEVISAQGYEPFGSLMPGRNYSSSSYDYGFNGMRKDDEIHGTTGTSYDFGARLYDPRAGRWLSQDPLASKYPDLSPYAFTMNNPVLFVDPDGRVVVIKDVASYKALLGTLKAEEIERITVDKNGVLTIKAIVGADSRNLANLRTLVDSKLTHNFITTDTYKSAAGEVTLGDRTSGRTIFPEDEANEMGLDKEVASPDGQVYVIIKPTTESGAPEVLAHEGFGHAVLGERKRQGEDVDPLHKFGPDGERNEDFKKQGWGAVSEARANYKRNSADAKWKEKLDEKVKEFNETQKPK